MCAALAAGPALAFGQQGIAQPASGIDLQYIDKNVRLQDDFFGHMNGKWLATVQIPPDKSSWGAFAKLREDTQPQLRAII
ncbi:MAG TPA: M13 family peptidase, partial [Noviherbaspirillum sp.]